MGDDIHWLGDRGLIALGVAANMLAVAALIQAPLNGREAGVLWNVGAPFALTAAALTVLRGIYLFVRSDLARDERD